MAKDPAVLLYTGDFLIGVADMPFLERGYYITLLCLQHQKGRLSEKTICFSLGLRSVLEIPEVMSRFEVDEDGNYYNLRMEEEAKRRAAYAESRRNNGQKGGRPPKQVASESLNDNNHMQNHMQNHMPNHTGTETITEDIAKDNGDKQGVIITDIKGLSEKEKREKEKEMLTHLQKEKDKKSALPDNAPSPIPNPSPKRRKPSALSPTQEARFNRFWATYPRKVSLGEAEKAWAKIEPDDELTEQIVGAVVLAKAKDSRFREERFTPHPATWLNDKSWLNEYSVAPPGSPVPPGEKFDTLSWLRQNMDGG